MLIKRNYYVYVILLLVFSVCLLSGCGSSKKQMAQEYRQSTGAIMMALERVGQNWDTLRNKASRGEISDIEFAGTIENELIPKMVKIQEEMEKIRPKKELQDIHEIGVKMINKQLQAFIEVYAAFYEDNPSKIATANNLLAEVRELERKYVNQLEEMLK